MFDLHGAAAKQLGGLHPRNPAQPSRNPAANSESAPLAKPKGQKS